VNFPGDSLWHDLLTYVWDFNNLNAHRFMLIEIRKNLKTFDLIENDKVDLYDLCNSIMNYPSP